MLGGERSDAGRGVKQGRPGRSRRVLGILEMAALGALGFGALLALWQYLSTVLPPSRLVPPSLVVEELQQHLGYHPAFETFGFGHLGYLGLLLYTIRNVVLGAAVGGSVGFVAGLFLARAPLIRAAVEPILLTLGTVPLLAVMPLLVIWFGIVSSTQVLLVAVYTAIVVTQYALRGAENLPPVYERRALTCGASSWTRLRTILLPGVLPEALAGLRIALAFAWGLETYAETLGAPGGSGQGIVILANVNAIEGLLASILLIGAVALVADAILVTGTRVVTRWS
jgi:ABC-type nitrate/sulfonate/bicarbonate transport system permease component